MPINPNYLECPIYFPIKKGYGLENETPFRGIDAKHIVHDLQFLDEEITNIEVFLGIDLGGAITVDAVTTTTLAANTYSNGTAGVGATITINGNGAFPTIDGQTAAVGKIYLIKNETGANRYKNGVYVLTTLGTASTQAVLTRTTTSDTSLEFDNQVVFATYPKAGTTNGGKYFVQTTTLPTVGTSNIIYITRTGGGTQNIEQTLIIGDDANTQDIDNLGHLGIGKVAVLPLDVIGDTKIATSTYTDGLFIISDTPVGLSPGGNVRLGNINSGTPGIGVGININVPNHFISLGIDYDIGALTNGIRFGANGGLADEGFYFDYNSGPFEATYGIGRSTGNGANIHVNDHADGSGSIIETTGPSGQWVAGISGAEGFQANFIAGTGAGFYYMGNQNKSNITIDDSSQRASIEAVNGIYFTGVGTGIKTVNGANTYTGTVAGAAALSVVNGLIMA